MPVSNAKEVMAQEYKAKLMTTTMTKGENNLAPVMMH